MAVKSSQSATRVLTVLELVAAHQPVGISALAVLLKDDRSAVQRAVVTLADAGWIRLAAGLPVRWELSAHIFTLAHLPVSTVELQRRARSALEALRAETGETVFLAIPDFDRFVVVETAESSHVLRMAARVGHLIEPRLSATGRAFLAYAGPVRQNAMLKRTPDARDLAEFAATKSRGFSLSAGDVSPGATNLAAPVLDNRAEPIAVLGVSGPSERLTPARHAEIGALLAKAAAALSQNNPPAEPAPPETAAAAAL